MKKIGFVFLYIFVCAIFSGCTSGGNSNQITSIDTNKLQPGNEYYQCEMHKEIISDKAGNCSKCDMKLIQRKKQ